jgi:hypothetical protein
MLRIHLAEGVVINVGACSWLYKTFSFHNKENQYLAGFFLLTVMPLHFGA